MEEKLRSRFVMNSCRTRDRYGDELVLDRRRKRERERETWSVQACSRVVFNVARWKLVERRTDCAWWRHTSLKIKIRIIKNGINLSSFALLSCSALSFENSMERSFPPNRSVTFPISTVRKFAWQWENEWRRRRGRPPRGLHEVWGSKARGSG